VKTKVLRPTVAAVAAACLAVPGALAPSASAASVPVAGGGAAAVDAGVVAAVPQLKLVLAEIAPDDGAAAAIGEPKLELLALPETAAAQVAAGGAAALPGAVVNQGREAAAFLLGDARLAATAQNLAAPSALLDLLGLPITTTLAIVAGINPPPTFPNPAQYTSLYTVINNAISVLRAPLGALLTGQFDQIGPLTSAAWATFATSVTTDLPASVGASLAYAGEVIASVLGTAVTPSAESTAVEAEAGADVQAAATPEAILDLLGLPITTTLAIVAGINPPPTFPNPAQYTSVYTVINNAISVLRAPLTALLTGQFDQVGPQTAAAWSTLSTSLTAGFPASVNASVAYAGQVISSVLGGAVHAPADEERPSSQTDATAASTPLTTLAKQFSHFVPDLGTSSELGSAAAATVTSLEPVDTDNKDTDNEDTDNKDTETPAELAGAPAEDADEKSDSATGSESESDTDRSDETGKSTGKADETEKGGKPDKSTARSAVDDAE
jgi:hypothetical protein